jgi:hypothetical protein
LTETCCPIATADVMHNNIVHNANLIFMIVLLLSLSLFQVELYLDLRTPELPSEVNRRHGAALLSAIAAA